MATVMAPSQVALQNILVATDFSTTSQKALQYAVAIAVRYNSKIHLVHVIEPIAYEFLSPQNMSEAHEQLRRVAEQQLQKVGAELGTVRHQVYLKDCPACDAVEEVVRQNDVDLVVVGTHGSEGIEKFVFGSTAEEIFRRVTCPVLTVGPNTPDIDIAAGLTRILFATDLVSDETGALAYALSLAREHKARLTLLHVMTRVQAPIPGEAAQFEQPYVNRLRGLISGDTHLPYPTDCRIGYGQVAPDAILGVARELPASLIVLSIRSRPSWATRLPDKAYRIVAESLCPVLTVREKENA